MNCFFSERVPAGNASRINIGGQTLVGLQSHFDPISLQQFSQSVNAFVYRKKQWHT
jgi:hypothetical protein